MTDFFSSIAEDVIRGILTELANEQDLARLSQIQKNWDFYRGDQIHYLMNEDQALLRHRTDASPEEIDQVRRKIRSHFNYTRLIVERYINGCYGLEVKRNVQGEENTAVLEQIWNQNNMESYMHGVQRIAEIEGICAVIPRWKEAEKKIVYERYGAQHLIPIPKPDSPTELYALILSWTVENKWGLVPDIVEDTLPSSRNYWRYTWNAVRSTARNNHYGPQKYVEIWTPDRVQAYLGKRLFLDIENPYGELPFAFFRAQEDEASFWGQTAINDVVAINHLINRLLSDLVEIVRVHGFSLLFISGDMVDQLVLKPTSFLKVNQVPGDSSRPDAKYLTPNSPISEIQQFIDWLIQRLADCAQTPRATITGGFSAESGFALTIQWLPYTQMLLQKRNSFKSSEQELARKTLLVSRTHLGQGDPDHCELSIEWIDDNFVPKKQDEQRVRDAFLLANDVITPIDLLRREQPDLTEEQLLERFMANVRFNRQIRNMAAQAGAEMDDFISALQSEAMRARVREKAAEAMLKEELEQQTGISEEEMKRLEQSSLSDKQTVGQKG